MIASVFGRRSEPSAGDTSGLDPTTYRLLDTLPIGLAIFDGDQRAILVNQAYASSLDMPPDSFPPGTVLADMLRAAAHRGDFGPGDPEAQVQAALRIDRGRPGRLRRRRFDGRIFDLHTVPTDGGGHVVCAVDSTALVMAREEAETLASRLTKAVSALRFGLGVFGGDRRLLMQNHRFAELIGLPVDRLAPGLPFEEFLNLASARDEYASLEGEGFLAAQRQQNREQPARVRRVRPNGQVVDLTSDPLADGGWTMTLVDVSPLARAEDEARQRADLLDRILNSIPNGVCLYGRDRRVAMFNRPYADIMAGAPLAIGDDLESIIRRRALAGEYGRGEFARIVEQQMAFDISRAQVRRRRRPNGASIDVRTVPLPDGGHISVVSDVSALTRAEDQVASRVQEMDLMLAYIRHGIILWDRENRVVSCNPVASELLGQSPDYLVRGRAGAEIVADILARGDFGNDEAARRKADALIGLAERAIIARDGRVLEVCSDPTPNGGCVTTLTDITETQHAEAELRRAKMIAEEANQAKSRFLTTMSHELRTPLNAVIGFSDTLMRDFRETAHGGRIAEYGGAINDAGRQLLTLVNSILDVARIEAGRVDIAAEAIDLPRLLRGCVRSVDNVAQAAEITVGMQMPPDFPVLYGDERRLRQVFLQLLSNAIKFTEAGGSVRIAVERRREALIVSIEDTGVGIDAADLALVFQPFSQVDGSFSRRFQGSGLGLYIARALVRAHGGELLLRSARGVGTTAEVHLPSNCLHPTHNGG